LGDDQFRNNIKLVDGHYEVCLPWRDKALHLPDNLDICQRRLKRLMRSLQNSPELLCEYNSIIQDQIDKNMVEVVDNPSQENGERIHYLLHHAVVRQDKSTTRLRIVFDASAKVNGPSLNDCLHVGPRFNQIKFGKLLRYRWHNYAFTADIEKAFLMISVAKKDRDVLSFLWIKDVQEQSPVIQVLRHDRVVFGVICSPYLLNATIRHHLEGYRETDPHLIESLMNSIYVDDLIGAADSNEAAWKLSSHYKVLLSEGGFNLML
jgi:hypothetical protein